MQTLLQDLRYGARMLRKHPGFTLIAALTLALGISANTALFTVYDAFVLKPLPLKDPDSIAKITGYDREGKRNQLFSYLDYVDYRDRNTSFAGLIAWSQFTAPFGEQTAEGADSSGSPGNLGLGNFVSGNYFTVLGAEMALGRAFAPEEDQMPGAHPVMVLSHICWTRHFNSDPHIVGRTVRLAGLPFTVIGVTAPEFIGLTPLPRLASANLPLWVTTPLALVAIDLGNYLVHFLLHRYGALWEFHKVHHSSRTLDWLATFRSHIVEQALRRLIAPALLIIAGFPIKAVVLAGGLFTAWGTLNHSNLKLNLRFLEPILITPRLHRLHHVPETENRNFGTFFTFWDRMRGTFVRAELEETCTFGVAGEIDSYPQSWLPQFVEPMRRLLRTRSMPAATSQRLY